MNPTWLFLIFHATVTAQESEITTQTIPVELSNSTESENGESIENKMSNDGNPTDSENLTPENGTTTDTPLVRPITRYIAERVIMKTHTSNLSSPMDSGFDFGSFIGGAVLAFGVTATVYFGIKFYRAHNPDYRHI